MSTAAQKRMVNSLLEIMESNTLPCRWQRCPLFLDKGPKNSARMVSSHWCEGGGYSSVCSWTMVLGGEGGEKKSTLNESK